MGKDYECEQVPVIINIPDNTVKLNVKATVMEKDDSLVEAEMTMTTAEVMDARIRGSVKRLNRKIKNRGDRAD